MNPFHNPYAGLTLNANKANRHRTTIDCSRIDVTFLNSLHGRKGTLQTTINLLLVKLITQLKQNGITDYNPNGFEQAVGGCCITLGNKANTDNIISDNDLPRSTEPDQQSYGKTTPRNDDGRVANVARVSAGEDVESPNPHGTPEPRQGKKASVKRKKRAKG